MSSRTITLPVFRAPDDAVVNAAITIRLLETATGKPLVGLRSADGAPVLHWVERTSSGVEQQFALTPNDEISPESHYRVEVRADQQRKYYKAVVVASGLPLAWADFIQSGGTPVDPADLATWITHPADLDAHLQPGDRAAIAAVSLPTAEAAEDLVEGQPARITAQSKLALADAATPGLAEVVGLVATATLTGFAAPYTRDRLTRADWTPVTGAAALVAGDTYYLDPAAPGLLTNTPPNAAGQTLVRAGVAVSTTTLEALIAPPILL